MQLAADIFPRLCDAVLELHEGFGAPLIHRDLKPSNIMVSCGGLSLIDQGIAREYKGDATTDTHHFGTRAYAPPEQFGFGQTTVRSDVYALGMILYFCLVEQTPDAVVRERGSLTSRIPDSGAIGAYARDGILLLFATRTFANLSGRFAQLCVLAGLRVPFRLRSSARMFCLLI